MDTSSTNARVQVTHINNSLDAKYVDFGDNTSKVFNSAHDLALYITKNTPILDTRSNFHAGRDLSRLNQDKSFATAKQILNSRGVDFKTI